MLIRDTHLQKLLHRNDHSEDSYNYTVSEGKAQRVHGLVCESFGGLSLERTAYQVYEIHPYTMRELCTWFTTEHLDSALRDFRIAISENVNGSVCT